MESDLEQLRREVGVVEDYLHLDGEWGGDEDDIPGLLLPVVESQTEQAESFEDVYALFYEILFAQCQRPPQRHEVTRESMRQVIHHFWFTAMFPQVETQ